MLIPAQTEDEAATLLEEARRQHPDATHHCWAWRLGPGGSERFSDDGEPAGTAGRPILNVLRGAELSDVVAIVTRWYGGTKLGRGGLARAYAGSVKEALALLATEERWPTVELSLELPYDRIGALKRLVHPPEVVISDERYESAVHLKVRVRADRQRDLEESLTGLGIRPLRDDR